MQLAASLKDAPQWARAAYIAALDPEATPRRMTLVAEDLDTGAIVGFTVAGLLPPQGELESIAVAAAGQRRGIGQRLMEAMVAEMAEVGVREALLEVRASNRGAAGLYRAMGWVEAGRRARYYSDPEEDAVLMRLELGNGHNL